MVGSQEDVAVALLVVSAEEGTAELSFDLGEADLLDSAVVDGLLLPHLPIPKPIARGLSIPAAEAMFLACS